MTITLTPQLEAMIEKKVASGHYASASDVVEEALRLLEEKDRAARLKAAIAVGMDAVKRGAVVEWGPDSMARLRREADEADRLGLPIDPDVCP